MAGFGVLWRVFGMANDYRDYDYCIHCDRPLRPGEETQKISEGYGDNRRTIIECLVCVNECHRPIRSFRRMDLDTVTLFLIFGAAFLYFGRLWFMAPDAYYSRIFGWILVGFLLVFIYIIVPTGEGKYRSIYERWVKKHGSNPETWPKNKYKFDLWPDHVDHDPEATKTTLQTANCSACGKPCSDANVCVMSEGKPIHKTCLYSPHEL